MENINEIVQGVKVFAETAKINPIVSEQELSDNVELVAAIKSKIKKLEATRKEFTADARQQIKVINDKFKMATAPLEDLEKSIKIQIKLYVEKKEREAAAELKRQQEEEAKRLAENPEAAPSVPVVKSQQNTVRTELGSASMKKIWKHELVDLSLVPVEYLALDSAKVTQAIRDGKREIPGIRIYQDTSIAIR
jgi:hypothetical protein